MREINTLLEPWDMRMEAMQGIAPPDRLFFICPWCHAEQDQSADNFNYWCSTCGKNAMDYDLTETQTEFVLRQVQDSQR